VPATAEELATIHAILDRFWAAVDAAMVQPPDRDWRLEFATGLAEIATNIVRHAYPTGASSGPMELRLRAYLDRVVACLTDRGVAFRMPPEPRDSPGRDPMELPEGGYGLAAARACVDRLDYSRTPNGENRWRLLKQFGPGAP
jgi:anti-sigma regulatory factor (Ser/Thr protein kinase)